MRILRYKIQFRFGRYRAEYRKQDNAGRIEGFVFRKKGVAGRGKTKIQKSFSVLFGKIVRQKIGDPFGRVPVDFGCLSFFRRHFSLLGARRSAGDRGLYRDPPVSEKSIQKISSLRAVFCVEGGKIRRADFRIYETAQQTHRIIGQRNRNGKAAGDSRPLFGRNPRNSPLMRAETFV